MAQSPERQSEGKLERGARLLRNVNLIAALAFEGAAVVFAPLAVPATALAGFNAVQAGGFELARNSAKRRRTKNARLKV